MPKSNLSRHGVAKKPNRIYMDYASSASAKSANSGAIHALGMDAKKNLNTARSEIAEILGAHSDEIIFTSGATESNNLAIMGILTSHIPHIVTINIEHASVLEVYKHLEKTKQAEVTYVSVEANGIVDPKKIKKAIRSSTILVSVMYANNEIGTIQPIREIAKEIRHFNKTNSKKILFHTDATQAVNYLPINVEKLGVDLMSFNGAKIYGPKGVGALYVKRKTPISSIMFGGDQEFGLRPGTENVIGVIELAKALKNVEQIKEKESKRLIKLRDYFIQKLQALTPTPGVGEFPLPQGSGKVILNGDKDMRLPNNINITIPNIPSDLLVIELSARGVMVSAKSACKSGDGKASDVIKAINPKAKETDGSIRFSLGRETSKKDIDYTIKSLTQILTKLKRWYN
jgi:cysteine desulfurase